MSPSEMALLAWGLWGKKRLLLQSHQKTHIYVDLTFSWISDALESLDFNQGVVAKTHDVKNSFRNLYKLVSKHVACVHAKHFLIVRV